MANTIFPQRLIQLRKEHKYSQAHAAELLSIPRSTYSGYETQGKEPDIDLLCKMAELFGVTTDYLMGLSDWRNGYGSVLDKSAKSICEKVNALPDSVRSAGADIVDNICVLLSRNLADSDEEYIRLYDELFKLLTKSRSDLKKMISELSTTPMNALRLSAFMERQNSLKSEVLIILDKLLQADLAAVYNGGKELPEFLREKVN